MEQQEDSKTYVVLDLRDSFKESFYKDLGILHTTLKVLYTFHLFYFGCKYNGTVTMKGR